MHGLPNSHPNNFVTARFIGEQPDFRRPHAIPFDLRERDILRHDASGWETVGAACHPTEKVAPNVVWLRLRCWSLMYHPSLMAGAVAVGHRFVLCPPRSTIASTMSSPRLTFTSTMSSPRLTFTSTMLSE